MFGATVTLVDEDTNEKAKYRIVGEIEANVKRADLDHLAAGPGAARQAQEGRGRSVDAGRRQVV